MSSVRYLYILLLQLQDVADHRYQRPAAPSLGDFGDVLSGDSGAGAAAGGAPSGAGAGAASGFVVKVYLIKYDVQ